MDEQQIAGLRLNALHYVANAKRYRSGLKQLG